MQQHDCRSFRMSEGRSGTIIRCRWMGRAAKLAASRRHPEQRIQFFLGLPWAHREQFPKDTTCMQIYPYLSSQLFIREICFGDGDDPTISSIGVIARGRWHTSGLTASAVHWVTQDNKQPKRMRPFLRRPKSTDLRPQLRCSERGSPMGTQRPVGASTPHPHLRTCCVCSARVMGSDQNATANGFHCPMAESTTRFARPTRPRAQRLLSRASVSQPLQRRYWPLNLRDHTVIGNSGGAPHSHGSFASCTFPPGAAAPTQRVISMHL